MVVEVGGGVGRDGQVDEEAVVEELVLLQAAEDGLHVRQETCSARNNVVYRAILGRRDLTD